MPDRRFALSKSGELGVSIPPCEIQELICLAPDFSSATYLLLEGRCELSSAPVWAFVLDRAARRDGGVKFAGLRVGSNLKLSPNTEESSGQASVN